LTPVSRFLSFYARTSADYQLFAVLNQEEQLRALAQGIALEDCNALNCSAADLFDFTPDEEEPTSK
jgi:hypothetical protein